MHAVIKDGQIYSTAQMHRLEIVADDGGVVTVMPLEIGWKGYGYEIVPQYPADPVPEGKVLLSETRVFRDGAVYTDRTYQGAEWPSLTNKQFWKVLALTGLHAGITAFVDSLPLGDQIEAKQSSEYRPDHWLIADNRAAFGLDDEQFKTIWLWGASL